MDLVSLIKLMIQQVQLKKEEKPSIILFWNDPNVVENDPWWCSDINQFIKKTKEKRPKFLSSLWNCRECKWKFSFSSLSTWQLVPWSHGTWHRNINHCTGSILLWVRVGFLHNFLLVLRIFLMKLKTKINLKILRRICLDSKSFMEPQRQLWESSSSRLLIGFRKFYFRTENSLPEQRSIWSFQKI